MSVDKKLCQRVKTAKMALRFYTTEEMAENLKVSKYSLEQTLSFRRNPTQKIIDALVDIGKVNRDWLENGTGKIFTGVDGEDIDMEESLRMLAESNKIMAESNKEIIKTNSDLVKEIIRLNTKDNKNE